MAKRIMIWSKASPDEGGYGDYVKVFDGEKIIYEGPCSAAPDPYDRNDPQKPWNKTYGWLAPGIYRWQKQDDGKKSWGYLHLYVNGGEEVDSRNPNPGGMPATVNGNFTENFNWSGKSGKVTIKNS